MNHVNTREEVMEAFRVFDKSNAGSISSSEFRQVLQELGEPLPANEIDEIIYEADGGSGTVQYEQFVNMLFMFD